MEQYFISVVDDHPLFRKGLADLISDFENIHLLFQATSGKDLLEKLQSATTKPDLILMDIEMPEMDGEETTLQIKQQYPEIKIIILSMHHEEKYLVRLLEKGINGYVTKDSDPEIIERAIIAVIRDGSYFNEKNVFSAIHNQMAKVGKPTKKHDFTQRELEVLKMICEGDKTAEIAEKLFISPRTVEGHRNKLLEKSGSKNCAELVASAIKNNLF